MVGATTYDDRYTEVMKTFEDLKETRERYESVWKQINDLVLPRRSDFDWSKTHIVKPNRKIYDPLPGYLARKAADGLLGNTMSRGNIWFRLHADNPNLDQMRAFRMHAEEVEYILYALLRNSTMYEAAHDSCVDALTVGHSVLYRETHPETGRLIYTARHPKEVWLGQNRWGQIDTIARKFFMEAREVVSEYRDDGTLPERFITSAGVAPYDRVSLIHIVRPRKDRDVTKSDKWNMEYESLTVLEDHGALIREGGFKRFPYPAVWRWRTNTGEVYARSPSYDALPDIIRLQEIAKTMMEFVQEQARPSRMYPLEMKGKIDFRPGGMTPYTDPSRRVYRMFEAQNAYPLGKDLIEQLRDQISEAYYADVFTLLSMNMDTTRTATEVQELTAERSALLTAVSERFTNEYMVPVIRDLYHYADEEGLLPPVPEALKDYDLSTSIEFLGPLAQNQRRSFLNTGINASLNHFASAAQLWPEVLDQVDPAKFGRYGAIVTGLSEKVLRSKREVEQIQQAREQQQAQQAQMEAMQQQASAMAQATKAPEPGSLGEEMME